MPRKPGKPGQLGDTLLSAHKELLRKAPRFSDADVLTVWRAIRDYALHHCLSAVGKGEASGTGAMSGLATSAQNQIDTIVDRIAARTEAATRRQYLMIPGDLVFGDNAPPEKSPDATDPPN